MDMKGHWRDANHISRIANIETLEEGISCYSLDDKLEAIENLYRYWIEVASATEEDFKNMQVTIFEGEKLDKWGSDGEDLAICTKTIKIIEAIDFINKLESAKAKLEAYEEEWEDDEQITKEQYDEILINLL